MSHIRIANAPCSWGSLEFEGLDGKAIGYAQMLDELAETGYAGTELGDLGYMPTDPFVLHAELQRRGLAMLGAFVPVDLKDASRHTAGEIAALKVARLLADVAEIAGEEGEWPRLVLADDNATDPVRTQHAGRVTTEMGLSRPQWKVFAQGAERIARAVKADTNLTTVFHHHCAGYVETPHEIARLLDLTDPDLVQLVFDTGHFTYGCGVDDTELMIPLLDRFADRIRYVHFKDCHRAVAEQARREGWDYLKAVRQGVFCELGQGSVDFPAVLQWLQDRYYEGWIVVEQDVLPGMGSPKEKRARRNRAYLRKLGV